MFLSPAGEGSPRGTPPGQNSEAWLLSFSFCYCYYEDFQRFGAGGPWAWSGAVGDSDREASLVPPGDIGEELSMHL